MSAALGNVAAVAAVVKFFHCAGCRGDELSGVWGQGQRYEGRQEYAQVGGGRGSGGVEAGRRGESRADRSRSVAGSGLSESCHSKIWSGLRRQRRVCVC